MGAIEFIELNYIIKKNTTSTYLTENGVSFYLSRRLHNELRSSLTQLEKNSIFLLARPDLGLLLHPIRPEAVRFMPLFDHGFYLADSYQGKVPEIVIAYPNAWEITQDELKSRFQDYGKDQWRSYSVADWTFLKARSPALVENASVELHVDKNTPERANAQ